MARNQSAKEQREAQQAARLLPEMRNERVPIPGSVTALKVADQAIGDPAIAIGALDARHFPTPGFGRRIPSAVLAYRDNIATDAIGANELGSDSIRDTSFPSIAGIGRALPGPVMVQSLNIVSVGAGKIAGELDSTQLGTGVVNSRVLSDALLGGTQTKLRLRTIGGSGNAGAAASNHTHSISFKHPTVHARKTLLWRAGLLRVCGSSAYRGGVQEC